MKNKVQFNLTVPQEVRDEFRSIAARQTLKSPDKLVTSATLASVILCEYIKNSQQGGEKNGLK